ncbi:Ig-like domain-containing protein [Parapedobacter lycopersici]|uniref:Ig-like domain-containing protein n=1 Tax=Parapedobacter lycopersici TaxID=1864939 RepID=UPI00333F8C91
MKRVTTSALCLSALAFALSCSKSKEINHVDPPDSTPIELTVTGIKSNDTLRNTLTAEIKAEHSSGIKSIEVFANDELVASATADSLSLSLNTLDLPDGTYSLKVVVSDEAGNKKEQAASVVISNVLVKIDRNLLFGRGDAATYFITDSAGQVVGRADFVNDGTYDDVVSLYPSEAFNSSKLNLTRVSTVDGIPPLITHVVSINRGAHLSNNDIGRNTGRLNEYHAPIPFEVNNVPEYDHLLVSTDALYYQLPVSPDYDYSLPYTTGSKSLLMIERNGSAKYGLFDIPAGSTKVELDATQANLIPAKKTIHFPSGLSRVYVTAYGKVHRDYGEFYTFAEKMVSGNSVGVFYPEDLVETLNTQVSYTQGDVSFSSVYYGSIPESIIAWDIQANVNKPSITDFDMDVNGDFGYYHVYFENKPYVGTGEGYIEVLVFAPRGQETFSFPDIAAEIAIPGIDLSQFKARQIKFYTHDVPVDFTSQFNFPNSLWTPTGGKQAGIATISLR